MSRITGNRWDDMRALIEAGWHSGWGDLCLFPENCARHSTAYQCGRHWCATCLQKREIDWDDIKRAEADADRQIYGGLGTPQRED